MAKEVQDAPIPKVENKIYADVYDVLLGGMLVSSVLFAVGVVLALIHPRFVPLTRAYVRREYDLRTIAHGLVTGSPAAFMMIATVLLILTPVARVAISVYAFYRGADRKFTIVTGIVLLVIVLTVLLGALGLK
ncbi:MAG: DUF1634 domain-containing protein [Terriglobia bacterium]